MRSLIREREMRRGLSSPISLSVGNTCRRVSKMLALALWRTMATEAIHAKQPIESNCIVTRRIFRHCSSSLILFLYLHSIFFFSGPHRVCDPTCLLGQDPLLYNFAFAFCRPNYRAVKQLFFVFVEGHSLTARQNFCPPTLYKTSPAARSFDFLFLFFFTSTILQYVHPYLQRFCYDGFRVLF